MSVEQLVLLGLISTLAQAVQTAAGFGAMLVCVTLGAHVMSIPEVLTLTIPLAVLQALYIVTRHRADIDRRLLLTRVLPLMGVGFAFALIYLDGVADERLRAGFAALILALGSLELAKTFRAQTQPRRPASPLISAAALLGSGVTQGVYASGGPLLSYALERAQLGKLVFRVSATAVFLLLNGLLGVKLALEGRYDASALTAALLMLPSVPLGLWLGELLHRRVSERRFRQLVYALLICAALGLLLR